MRWVRSDLGTPALTREVAALRCGLDAAPGTTTTARPSCAPVSQDRAAARRTPQVGTETLPFDAARAHALYKALFGQVEDLIRDKHLLIVPSGPLTQLPFQVLVTEDASRQGPTPTTGPPRGSHASMPSRCCRPSPR